MTEEVARRIALFTFATVCTFPIEEVKACSWIKLCEDCIIEATTQEGWVRFEVEPDTETVEVLDFKGADNG